MNPNCKLCNELRRIKPKIEPVKVFFKKFSSTSSNIPIKVHISHLQTYYENYIYNLNIVRRNNNLVLFPELNEEDMFLCITKCPQNPKTTYQINFDYYKEIGYKIKNETKNFLNNIDFTNDDVDYIKEQLYILKLLLENGAGCDKRLIELGRLLTNKQRR